MKWILEDIRNGHYFHQVDYRSHGVWMPSFHGAVTFDSDEAALNYARQVGMKLDTICALQLPTEYKLYD